MLLRNKIGELKVKKAIYIDGYRLSIVFSDGKSTLVDFRPFLEKKGDGYLRKYKNQSEFKNFSIENGNIVWGDNWDLIFPVTQLYKGQIKL